MFPQRAYGRRPHRKPRFIGIFFCEARLIKTAVYIRMYHERSPMAMPRVSSLSPQTSGSASCCSLRRIVGATAVVGSASAAALHYADSCSQGEHSWTLGRWGNGSLECFSSEDSNTIATLVAISLYCVSTGILYDLQHQKKYVDVFLVCGIALGLAIGFATGLSPREMLFHLLPGSALAVLVMSGFGPDGETQVKDCVKTVTL
ncbi:hypothetical protein CDV31_012820 [Fusarium ambrosium]|uniref:Uncharacterized protein n=1 Tax=Fusarium ambrosium TaxID=131363 RepID=A0A428T7A1_9HYPO|nr:hypothetical protein CDV31_012820 [Fusarium ambrosium]